MVDVKKRLYRLPKQGQIAGVCAGLAEYFDFDVVLMRVIFVISAFVTGGAVVVLYIILAIVLPVDNSDEPISAKIQNLGQEIHKNKTVGRVRNYLGIGLLIFGLWLLIDQIFPQFIGLRWNYIWPVALMLTGLLIIIRRGKNVR